MIKHYLGNSQINSIPAWRKEFSYKTFLYRTPAKVYASRYYSFTARNQKKIRPIAIAFGFAVCTLPLFIYWFILVLTDIIILPNCGVPYYLHIVRFMALANLCRISLYLFYFQALLK